MTYKAQHTNNKETEQQTNNNHSSTTTSAGSSSSVATEPGVHSLSAHDLEIIRQSYVDILGQLNASKAHDIERAIKAGLDAGAILEAIDQTAMARRPSHYYLRAVLNRYICYGLLTAADVLRDREERMRERYQANREQWSTWYHNPEEDLPW